jgi:hypothetical protein
MTFAIEQKAPNYFSYRVVEEKDTLPIIDKNLGINSATYHKAHIQVVPDEDANPTVEVLFWSEALGAFVQEHTKIEKAGVGAGVPFEFTIDCLGRIFFVAVTTMTEGSTEILVSGFDQHYPK